MTRPILLAILALLCGTGLVSGAGHVHPSAIRFAPVTIGGNDERLGESDAGTCAGATIDGPEDGLPAALGSPEVRRSGLGDGGIPAVGDGSPCALREPLRTSVLGPTDSDSDRLILDPAISSMGRAGTDGLPTGPSASSNLAGGDSPILDPVLATLAPRPDTPTPTDELVQDIGTASLAGIASWGDGWEGVVTRLPRGTAITVCGALGCWSGPSVGYGPATWTGRIADLSRIVFTSICGPVSKGLCAVEISW